MSPIYIPFQFTPIFSFEDIYTQFLFTSNSSCSLIYIQYAFTSDFMFFLFTPVTYLHLISTCLHLNQPSPPVCDLILFLLFWLGKTRNHPGHQSLLSTMPAHMFLFVTALVKTQGPQKESPTLHCFIQNILNINLILVNSKELMITPLYARC